MIRLFVTTAYSEQVRDIINKEYRLNELVQVTTQSNEASAINISDKIEVMPDWENRQPPILFPIAPFDENVLLGVIYVKLNNFERAYELMKQHPTVLKSADLLNRLQNAVPFEIEHLAEDSPVAIHNSVILMHYGFSEKAFSDGEISNRYRLAISQNLPKEQVQFSTYHLAQWHIDNNDNDTAESLINNVLSDSPSKLVSIAFKDLLCKIWQKQLVVPYDQKLMDRLKTTLWECLEYYEASNRTTEAAIVLMDASYVATISESFSEALGYINRAISVFENEQLAELTAQAHFSKANLLQTWAQKGNPQFYRTAVQSFQSALRIFTKEEYPDIFGEIQHQLGKVYAEIPDEVKKKGVWAAVSVSSFNEALSYYNKIDFPYQFAMICNSFGNAYTKYPSSLHTDNFDKALAWYREALEIRTASDFPVERVLTLSNYLEASWFVGNQSDFDEARYEEMMAIAHEIIELTNDEQIASAAKNDIERLLQLKSEAIN
jgi:tetratricopeptide (TPR) repeat protein